MGEEIDTGGCYALDHVNTRRIDSVVAIAIKSSHWLGFGSSNIAFEVAKEDRGWNEEGVGSKWVSFYQYSQKVCPSHTLHLRMAKRASRKVFVTYYYYYYYYYYRQALYWYSGVVFTACPSVFKY